MSLPQPSRSIETESRTAGIRSADSSRRAESDSSTRQAGPAGDGHAAVDRPTVSALLPPDAHPRQKKTSHMFRTLLWMSQLVVAIGVGYWFASTRAQPDTRIHLPSEMTAGHADTTSDAVPVTTTRIARRQVQRSIDAVGNLHGYDELTLKTKVSGRVSRILHDFADRVEPGALLLELDPTDAQLAVEQAKRSLNSELAKWGFADLPQPNTDLTQLPTVVSAKLRSDWSKSQYARLTALQTRGSASIEELEQAKTNSLVAESDYANQLLLARAGAATAQLKKAELDIAEQQLREMNIYVPQREDIAGLDAPKYTITDRYVTEGAWLAVGSDVFRLVIDDVLKLRLSIPEKHAAGVRVGQKVEVETMASAAPAIGTIVRIGPSVDPETRTFQIEAEVPNLNATLKTGGFAKARIIVDEAATATTIPLSALVTFAGVQKVFVLDGDQVSEVQVKLGQQTAEWIEIVEPALPTSAEVIVSGQSLLADGSIVRLRDAVGETPAIEIGTESNTATPTKSISNESSVLPGSAAREGEAAQ